jgi:hypothetical protein
MGDKPVVSGWRGTKGQDGVRATSTGGDNVEQSGSALGLPVNKPTK